MHYHLICTITLDRPVTQVTTSLPNSGTQVCGSFQLLALTTTILTLISKLANLAFPWPLCTSSFPALLVMDASSHLPAFHSGLYWSESRSVLATGRTVFALVVVRNRICEISNFRGTLGVTDRQRGWGLLVFTFLWLECREPRTKLKFSREEESVQP